MVHGLGLLQPVRLGCNRLGWSSGWQPATSGHHQPQQPHQPFSNSNKSKKQVPFFSSFGAKHISILM
jgi:hypothetical protein